MQQGVSMSNLAALDAGEIDIAVVFEPGGPTRNEVLMVDPTVWVTSDPPWRAYAPTSADRHLYLSEKTDGAMNWRFAA